MTVAFAVNVFFHVVRKVVLLVVRVLVEGIVKVVMVVVVVVVVVALARLNKLLLRARESPVTGPSLAVTTILRIARRRPPPAIARIASATLFASLNRLRNANRSL